MTRTEFDHLPLWDGVCYDIIHNQAHIRDWNMKQDPETGAIYYLTHESEPQVNVWCPASRLYQHLRYLHSLTM